MALLQLDAVHHESRSQHTVVFYRSLHQPVQQRILFTVFQQIHYDFLIHIQVFAAYFAERMLCQFPKAAFHRFIIKDPQYRLAYYAEGISVALIRTSHDHLYI